MGINERNNSNKSIVSGMAAQAGKGNKAKKDLKQQAYYIQPRHIKAIEMRLYENKMEGTGETDKSALVRAALEQYFSKELKVIDAKDQNK